MRGFLELCWTCVEVGELRGSNWMVKRRGEPA